METRYPIRKPDGTEYQHYDEVMAQIGHMRHGWWLAGANRHWHGGIHISKAIAPCSVLEEMPADKAVPLQCMAGGEVVALRVNAEYKEAGYGKEQKLKYSGTFVLVRSIHKPDANKQKSWLTFYTLYMHLAPLCAYPKATAWRVTEKGDGLNMRRYTGHEREDDPVCTETEGQLTKGTVVQVIRQMTFTHKHQKMLFGLIQKPKEGHCWVSLSPEYMEPLGETYSGLPDWMQEAVNSGTYDSVIVPAKPIGISAGASVGFLGRDDAPAGREGVATDWLAHIEVLSPDSRMPAFLENPEHITSGRGWVKAKANVPLYQRSEVEGKTTFTATGENVAAEDAGQLIEPDLSTPYQDASGQWWFQFQPNLWLRQDGVDELSQYDLQARNFTALEQADVSQFDKTLTEGWVGKAFRWIDTTLNPGSVLEATDKHTSVWTQLADVIDLNKDGKISETEIGFFHETLARRLRSDEEGVAQLLRRLVIKHDSEWHGGSNHQRWQNFYSSFNTKAQPYLKQWRDDTEWMSQVDAFKDGKPVWHFHPLEFLRGISSKDNCACDRDITFEELCTIAPGANKKVLEQYLPAFNEGFREFGIITCREKSHFLAQCCHESRGLQLTKEINGEKKDYTPWYGRGLIQLTWQDAYNDYGAYVGEDFVSNEISRRKITQYPHCVKSAFWFYCINKNLNRFAKNDDFNMVTAVINGGFNGYNDRLNHFNLIVKTLQANHLSVLNKEQNFLFEESAIYNYRVYAYSWGRYHDPLRKENGTEKNKSEALKAYRRAIVLYQDRQEIKKVSVVNENINALEIK